MHKYAFDPGLKLDGRSRHPIRLFLTLFAGNAAGQTAMSNSVLFWLTWVESYKKYFCIEGGFDRKKLNLLSLGYPLAVSAQQLSHLREQSNALKDRRCSAGATGLAYSLLQRGHSHLNAREH